MNRKMNRIIFGLVFGGLLVLPNATRATPVTILDEGFENGIPANAVVTGPTSVVALTSGAYEGVRRFQMIGDSDPNSVASLMLPLNFTGYEDPILDFWSKFNSGIEGPDIASVSLSVDGGLTQINLLTLQDQPTGGWANSILPLPSIANNQPMVQLLFVGNFNGASSDAFSLDDIVVTATAVPEPASGLAVGALSLFALIRARRKK